jgi:hypothetical protein
LARCDLKKKFHLSFEKAMNKFKQEHPDFMKGENNARADTLQS